MTFFNDFEDGFQLSRTIGQTMERFLWITQFYCDIHIYNNMY